VSEQGHFYCWQGFVDQCGSGALKANAPLTPFE
jgi:hypothetical protein